MAEIQGLLVRLEATTSLLRGELAKADKAVADTASRAEKAAARAEQAISGMGRSIGAAFGGLSVAAVARDLVQTTMQFEKLDFRMRTVSGSAEAFAANNRYVSETANRMGLDIVGATQSFSGLLAAQQNGKITGEQARDIFEGLANASAALGISNEQLKLSYFGLGQVLGSATVTMEDVRQVTDPMPGLFDKIAGAAGRTAGEFKTLISDGKVTSDVFSRYLVQALDAYEGKAEQAAEGLNGSWTRVQNAWIELKRTLEEPITDTLTPLLTAANAALKEYRVGSEGFKPMEERGVDRLKYDLERAQRGRAAAVMRNDAAAAGDFRYAGNNEDLTYYDRLIGQIQARLAFLEGPPAGAGPAAPTGGRPAAPTLPPPPPKKEPLTEEQKRQRAEQRKAESEAAAAERQFSTTLENLKHEQDQLGRTAKEQELYNALKAAGTTIDTERGKQIAAQVKANQADADAIALRVGFIEAENQQMEEGRRIYEAVRTPLDAYNDRMTELRRALNAGTIDQRTFNLAVADAKDQLGAAKLPKDLQFVADVGAQAFDRIGSSITNAFVSGEKAMVSLKSIGLGVVSELTQAFWRLALTNPLNNAMTGGKASTLQTVLGAVGDAAMGYFGAGGGLTGDNYALGTPTGYNPTAYAGNKARAAGGPVAAGQAYVVGEREAELFVPSTPGRIMPRLPNVAGPAPMRSGDTLHLEQHLHISTGVAATVKAEINNLMPQIAATSRAAVLDAQARRGRSL